MGRGGEFGSGRRVEESEGRGSDAHTLRDRKQCAYRAHTMGVESDDE